MPEIYINASYPATKDWPSNTFEKINVNTDYLLPKDFNDLLKSCDTNKKGSSKISIQITQAFYIPNFSFLSLKVQEL